jgi:signal transduction histidine kinase
MVSQSDAQQGITLKIAVQDTGIGIGKRNIKKLKTYTLFNKLCDAEADRLNPTGTGLGLAICHKLAHKLGGTFDFDSIETEGTV